MFDNYGQVIPPQDGKLARLNYGGDAPALKKGGALESRVEVAALWSGEVSFDESGKAVIPLGLPNFNGELALMALAWNEQQVGQAERAVKSWRLWWPTEAGRVLGPEGMRPVPWCNCAT